MITIIDEQEYATCGLDPCNSAGIIPLYLPKSGNATPEGNTYKGDLPKLEAKVTVVGQVKSTQQGRYFDVERILQGSTVLIEKNNK